MQSIQHPTAQDLPRLREIWAECFPDDIDSGYCDFFFANYYKPEHTLVLREEEIETMGYFFRGTHRGDDGIVRGYLYLYAAGTAKAYRGRNNLARLVEEGMAYARRLGFAGMFVTAAEGIEFLYDRCGFRRTSDLFSYTAPAQLAAGEVPKLTLCPYGLFSELRGNYLASLDCAFGWQPETEMFMYKELNLVGKVLLASWQGRSHYVCCTNEQELILRETDAPEELLPSLTAAVRAYFGGGETILCRHTQSQVLLQAGFAESQEYYGHYRLLADYPGSEKLPNAYLNLIAD